MAQPTLVEPLNRFQDCPACPEMIELPTGSFLMGAPDDEFRTIAYIGVTDEGRLAQRFATAEDPYIPRNEGPQNRVTVDIRIAMSRTEITFDDWTACVVDGGCNGYVPDGTADQWGDSDKIAASLADPRFKPTPSQGEIAKVLRSPAFLPIGGRYPVNSVSYLDATSYVDWLNRKLGTDAYRLPTEAEWEYAARAGTTTRFAQGYEPKPEEANISGAATANMEQRPRPDLRTLGHPVPVDELDAANPWGLRHMSGNVAEITLSCTPTKADGSPDVDRPLPDWDTTSEWLERSVLPSCDRVTRGGNYGQDMNVARVAARGATLEAARLDFIGFRIVKELDR
ncbi:MAG: formylglycine-generating enzyme family protein [Tabrizicola sp.]|uniref:formylglycine-generating enzyme family protein n=1 Tax=Tabrizicola sp. TaxID=2005166 RepID=UPI002ABBAE6F|nr:formylglycine-generating enzyme family protein [Tabrizicola sp.]MDZ4086800.1 formylglycine-generating enzyme family protein [Tabrizicola sp.]